MAGLRGEMTELEAMGYARAILDLEHYAHDTAADLIREQFRALGWRITIDASGIRVERIPLDT